MLGFGFATRELSRAPCDDALGSSIGAFFRARRIDPSHLDLFFWAFDLVKSKIIASLGCLFLVYQLREAAFEKEIAFKGMNTTSQRIAQVALTSSTTLTTFPATTSLSGSFSASFWTSFLPSPRLVSSPLFIFS